MTIAAIGSWIAIALQIVWIFTACVCPRLITLSAMVCSALFVIIVLSGIFLQDRDIVIAAIISFWIFIAGFFLMMASSSYHCFANKEKGGRSDSMAEPFEHWHFTRSAKRLRQIEGLVSHVLNLRRNNQTSDQTAKQKNQEPPPL